MGGKCGGVVVGVGVGVGVRVGVGLGVGVGELSSPVVSVFSPTLCAATA